MSNEQHNNQAKNSKRSGDRRRRSRMYTLNRFLFIGFLLMFVIAVGGIAHRMWQDWHDAQAFAQLNELLTDSSGAESQGNGDKVSATPVFPFEGENGEMEQTKGQILAKYQKVYDMNPDLYGWISIEGTEFSYPVMYTPEDEEYYLRRGFDGSYARSGVPFIDTDCEPGCDNYLIYGHNMTNGTMFAQLLAYEDESYWEEHPVIRFDTLYEEGEYEIVAAFFSRVFYKYETNVFRFYEYTDLSDPDDFSKYVGEVFDLALYDTDANVRYGDKLITLITCSYENRIENERFVIVARKLT